MEEAFNDDDNCFDDESRDENEPLNGSIRDEDSHMIDEEMADLTKKYLIKRNSSMGSKLFQHHGGTTYGTLGNDPASSKASNFFAQLFSKKNTTDPKNFNKT